jgi:hypothetical protein
MLGRKLLHYISQSVLAIVLHFCEVCGEDLHSFILRISSGTPTHKLWAGRP